VDIKVAKISFAFGRNKGEMSEEIRVLKCTISRLST